MTDRELQSVKAKIANAYIQYLLYKNGEIKSSSLSSANDSTDLTRKLCFFIKTGWNRDVEAKNISDVVDESRIRNGRVEITHNLNVRNTDYQQIVSHMMNGLLISRNLLTNGSEWLSLLRGTNYFQMHFDVFELLEGRSRNNTSQNVNRLKDLIDVSYDSLVSMRNNVCDAIVFGKEISTKMHAITPASINPNSQWSEIYYPEVRWNIREISFLIKSLVASNSNHNTGNTPIARFISALNITIAIIEDRNELFETNFNNNLLPVAIYGAFAYAYSTRSIPGFNSNLILESGIEDLERLSSSLKGTNSGT